MRIFVGCSQSVNVDHGSILNRWIARSASGHAMAIGGLVARVAWLNRGRSRSAERDQLDDDVERDVGPSPGPGASRYAGVALAAAIFGQPGLHRTGIAAARDAGFGAVRRRRH
jgi:hypothetical protein